MRYPWQEQQWQQLWQSVKSGRLPHALLLSGMTGIGKFAFAMHTAQSLLCKNITDSGDPCDACHSCRLVVTNAHPNVYHVVPEKDGHAIKVDQIRALSEFVQQSSFQGQYRIVIINPAHSMNVNAANALLKTLEEPASDAIILLVTDQPNYLPATIRSRCQRLTFPRPEHSAALQWLCHALPNEVQPEQWLRLAHGAPLLAVELVQGDAMSVRTDIFQGLQLITDKQTDPLALAAKWQKLDPVQCLDLFSGWIADLIRLQVGCPADQLLNQDYEHALAAGSQRIPLNNNLRLLEMIQLSRRQMRAGINFNKQLLLESLLIKWAGQQ